MNKLELLDAIYELMQDRLPRSINDILSGLNSVEDVSSEVVTQLLNEDTNFFCNKLSKRYQLIGKRKTDQVTVQADRLSDELNQIFVEIDQALNEEKNEIKKNPTGKIFITNGNYIGEKDRKKIYSFTIDKELFLPIDSPLAIEQKGKSIEGTLVSLDDVTIVLSLDEYIGDTVLSAILKTDPWYLIEKLRIRIKHLKNFKNLRLVIKILQSHTSTRSPLTLPDPSNLLNDLSLYANQQLVLNDSQIRAIHKVTKSELTFIWGPPGTGKTRTLSATCLSLMKQGETVLVVAHSNVAVDVAMMDIAKALEHKHYLLDQGSIIRLGTPQHSDMQQPLYEKMSIRGILRRKQPNLIQEIEKLEKELRHKTSLVGKKQSLSELDTTILLSEIERCKSTLALKNSQMKDYEKDYLRHARVIGCTFSKLAISDDLNERHFGAVLIDEASMASVPNCIFASGFATERVAIYGDFRQLAPIALSEKEQVKKWLWRDIFSYAGIVATVDSNSHDERLILLDTQYRMHPTIADIPNKLFYRNLLSTDDGVLDRTEVITRRLPNKGECVINVDPSMLSSVCVKEKESKSRFNLVSAICSVIYLEQSLLDGSSVGIETPYNAQSRLVGRMLRDLKYEREDAMVATVHRFQGSERDVIIFDTVESSLLSPSLLLKSDEIPDRLANVAISRARGKFIFISDPSLRKNLEKNNGLKKLSDTIHAYKQAYQPTWNEYNLQLIGQESCGIQKFIDLKEMRQVLQEDLLATSHEEIAISWASIPYHPYFSADWLKQVKGKKNQLPRFYFSGKGNNQLRFGLQNTQVWNMGGITDYSFIGIDRKVLWLIISTNRTTPTMLRFNMPSTIDLLYQFLEIVPAEEVELKLIQERVLEGDVYGSRCTRCGENMYPVLGDYSTPYLLCTDSTCGYTKKLDIQAATAIAQLHNIVCGNCGGQVKARKGDYGIFIGCSNYPSCKWTKNLSSLI